MFKKKFLLILFLSSNLSAQIFASKDLEEGIFFLTKYISSDEYSSIRKTSSDLDSIDSLFVKSLRYYNNDIAEALLALTFATLPYSQMPLSLPVSNSKINIPLPTPQKLLIEKNKNLPSHFLDDSPKNDFGDKDKLAHFFGNAYLSYTFPMFNISDFLSIFVEKFEEAFKVEGAFDKRDIFVNNLGKKFGNALHENNSLLPSYILTQKNLE
ncbi:MAG: hypothetical protein Fur0015_11570 [Ignavibacteriales bacterium]